MNGGSWPDRLLGVGLTLLLAGLSIYWAVHLILKILVPLLVILGVVAVLVTALQLVRRRQRW